MKNHKLFTNFTALVQQQTQKRPIFVMKAIYQVVYSTVPHLWQTTYNCSRAPAKLKLHLTTNHSHMTNKSGDYFKWLLESQHKQSKGFVSKVSQ
jgi:hypothetical protein